MNIRADRCAAVAPALAALLLAAPAVRSAPPIIIGGDTVLWTYRLVEPGGSARPELLFAYARPHLRGLRFDRLRMAPTGGAVGRAAVRGANLHIFFDDGTHYRLRAPQSRARAGDPTKNDFPELKLPDARLPRALCGDDVDNLLGAIILTSDAEEFASTPTTQPATPSPKSESDPDTTSPPTEPRTRYTLVQYVHQRWQWTTAIPAFFDQHTWCAMAAYGGTYALVFATPQAPNEVRHTGWNGSSWSEPRTVPGASPGDVLCVLSQADTVAIAVKRPSPTDGTFTILPLLHHRGNWTAGETLTLGEADLTCPDGATSVHRFADQLAVATSETDEKGETTRVGFWPLEGGAPAQSPVEVRALAPTSEPIATEQTRMLVAMMALTFILLIVFLRRRDNFLTDLPAPPGYVQARLGRRFTAFVIDLTVVSVMAFPAFVTPWMAHNGIETGAQMWNDIEQAVARSPDAVYWRWMAAAGLYILYGIISEATMAATPGKLLLRLRVCNNRGLSPSLGAIIVRNLLRFELYPMLQLVPTAVLVALTRNRQRLGDLVANTIVVEKTVEE